MDIDMNYTLSYIGDVNSNRFLLFDLRNRPNQITDIELQQLGRMACHTKLFDDLLVFNTSDVADVRYRIFGGDMREAEFCGNGALLSLYLLQKGLPRKRYTLETRIGICPGMIKGGRPAIKMSAVKAITFEPKPWIPSYLETHHLSILGARCAGEPHLLISAPDILKVDPFDQRVFECVCAPLCDSFDVIGGVNVTMILFTQDHRRATIRTYERGARRMTSSCGSGSIAAASLLGSMDRKPQEFLIQSAGGVHKIYYNSEDQSWWLTASSIQLRPIHLGRLLSTIKATKSTVARQKQPQMRSHIYHDEAIRTQKKILGPHRP